jgi:hypothetical protein
MAMTWFEKQVKLVEGTPEYEFEKALYEFEEALCRNIKQIPPEFSQAVTKHFWELIDAGKQTNTNR